jgi:hypothetical protein
MVLMELAVVVGEILLVGAVVFGALYAIGFVAELFDGHMSVSTAVFVLFTIAGTLLYFDFKPSEMKKQSDKRTQGRRTICELPERKAIKAYSAR